MLARWIWIYALRDPKTFQMHYIGRTGHPERRFSQYRCHQYPYRQSARATPIHQWLRKLHQRKKQPIIQILAWTTQFNGKPLERQYIQQAFRHGEKLLNRRDM